jgi:NodT family efflux transporter outer membrane factor (OMF) lipoprotein
MSFRFKQKVVLTVMLAQLSGCTVGPDYVKPSLNLPADFKEVKGWKQAQPRDQLIGGQWWLLFNDAQLNKLEEQVEKANQSVIQAEAQYRQAQHLVQSAQSAFFPVLNMTATFNRFRAATGQTVVVSGVRNLFGQALGVAWEPDLWGSVRRQVEANTGSAQASAATIKALTLSAQASLAQNYYQLRSLDAQKAILDETVANYRKVLEISQHRYEVGVVSRSDVVQAETQLSSVEAQAINLGVQRAKLEHAIAVLIGKSPTELTIKTMPLDGQPPVIPGILPSELLERRPDIAVAERKASAANAQIGVAKAAYFPTLNLAATNGFQSSIVETLFTVARRYWALGPAGAALTLFDGGAKHSQYKQAIDGFDASAAEYRQTVLTALQEVEDNLAALRILADEAQVQEKTVASANLALQLTTNQYKAGTVSYLNVMTAQTTALTNRQTALQVQSERLQASVLLVKALGGGWNVKALPTKEQAIGDMKWTDFLILPID